MKPVLFWGVILLLLPFVSAFDCSLTFDNDYCIKTLNSDLNETEKDLILSSLLYENYQYPDHNFIEEYNLDIIVNSLPEDTQIYDSKYIKNAWLSFLAVFPSVYEDDTLYVGEYVNALSAYDYLIKLPSGRQSGDCRTEYRLLDNSANINYYFNDVLVGSGEFDNIVISNSGTIKAKLSISTRVEIKHYKTQREEHQYFIGGDIYYTESCEYSYSETDTDSLTIEEKKEVRLYDTLPYLDITITNIYHSTTKGHFNAENYSFFKISFNNSYIQRQKYYYDLIFEKKPYYIAYLRASTINGTAISNLFLSEENFYISDTSNCSLYAYNHFFKYSSECDLTLYQEDIEELNIGKEDLDLSLLFYVLTFIFIIYIIYRLLKSQAKKIIIPILLLLIIFTPTVLAQEDESCGITNLATCIPEKLYDFLLVIINAPIQPLLDSVQSMLTADISIDIFYSLWSMVRYILSFFYVFLFIYVGFVFLTSSGNPIQRAHAKDMLKNIFIMIILIQGSFFIYDLILDLSSIMNNVIMSKIDPTFFMITADNVVNISLEFMYASGYVIMLFFTLLMLLLRFLVVGFGVVLFPIGLFCYFVPPLKAYGKFMINSLLIFIFMTFIDLLIILGCSMLIDIAIFENIEILIMIVCFGIVNYTLILTIRFAMKMSVTSSLKDDLNQAVKYMALAA
jgi:hypothetical protein